MTHHAYKESISIKYEFRTKFELLIRLVFPIGSKRRAFLKSKVLFGQKIFIKIKRKLLQRKFTISVWPTDTPLVSIVIPCYNYGIYIEQAIDSVLKQTFQNFEIIVIDGGSSDQNSIEILQNLKKPKTTIYFRNERHLVGDNRNYGINMAKGKYICCLDADDMIAPTYLEKALFFLECFNYDVVHPSVQSFGDDDLLWRAVPTTFDNMITKGNYVSTVSVFKKTAWIEIGGYKDWPVGEGYVPEDWDFWVKLIGNGYRFKNISEPLMLYRVHSDGLMGLSKTTCDEQLLEIYKENKKLLSFSNWLKRIKKNLLLYYSDNPTVNLMLPKGRQKILLVLPFMIIGGADTILLRIFESLKKEFDITIITTLNTSEVYGDNTERFLKISEEIYHLAQFLSTEEEMQEFVNYLLKTRGIDLIFLVGSKEVYKFLPEIKQKFPHIKIIDQLFNEIVHIDDNRKYSDIIDLTIVANKKIYDVLTNNFGEVPEKVKVIIHGVKSKREIPSSQSSDSISVIKHDCFTISYFGRFSIEKAPDLFVEIVAKCVNERNILLQAIMTGNGPEYQKITDMIEANNLKEKIFVPGFVDDIGSFLEETDVLILPSRLDGLPIIMLEVMSCGIPIIASDVGGVSTVVKDGYNGFLCNAADIDDFANHIELLYNNEALLKTMKENALEFFNNNVSEDRMNSEYLDAITTILSK